MSKGALQPCPSAPPLPPPPGVGPGWFGDAIWVDNKNADPGADGSMFNPLPTIQGAVDLAQARMDALPVGGGSGTRNRQVQTIVVAGGGPTGGGFYDEDVSSLRGNMFLMFLALGRVTLGDGAAVPAGDQGLFLSTTPRSVTWLNRQSVEDADTGLGGGDTIRRPQLVFGVFPSYGEMTSSQTAIASGWDISGDLVFINPAGVGEATTCEVHLQNVKLRGDFDMTADAGIRNCYFYRSFFDAGFLGASLFDGARVQIAESCEFDTTIICSTYNRLVDCEVQGGMTVTAFSEALPPGGLYHTNFSGTYTSASDMVLDCVTNGFFVSNGAALAGGAAKVLLDDCDTGPFALPVVAGLVLWLDADDAATITIATGVSLWADKSPEGNDVAQAVAAQQPQFLPDVIGGKPVVRFDGTDDNLVNLAFTGLVSRPGATVASVWRRLDDPSTNAVLVQAFAGAATSFPRIQFATPIAGRQSYHTGTFSSSVGFSRDFDVQRGFPHIFSSVFDGSEPVAADRLSLWIDGDNGDPLDYGGGPLPSADTGVVDAIRLGTTSVPGFEINADLAEVLVYDRALSVTERRQVEAYLRTKWEVAA